MFQDLGSQTSVTRPIVTRLIDHCVKLYGDSDDPVVARDIRSKIVSFVIELMGSSSKVPIEEVIETIKSDDEPLVLSNYLESFNEFETPLHSTNPITIHLNTATTMPLLSQRLGGQHPSQASILDDDDDEEGDRHQFIGFDHPTKGIGVKVVASVESITEALVKRKFKISVFSSK